MRVATAVVLLLAALACAQLSVQAASATKPKPAAAPATPAAAAASPAQSYYQLLGVTQSEASDAALLKKSYRKLALLHHPDKATSDAEKREKQDLFVKLANAYEILSSTRLRMRYELLVSQGQMEYDSRRDWEAYDVSRGFKPKPKTKAQQEAEFKFKTAQDIFKKAAEEQEEFALWSALAIAFSVALLPAAWMWYQKKAQAAEAVAARKARSSDLRATQDALAELQAEQKREAAERREADRAHQQQLRRERQEAAAEAAADSAAAAASSSSAASVEGEEWEVIDGVATRVPPAGADDAAADADSSSSDDDDSSSHSTVIKCALCRKSFKSAAQMDNHVASNQHKKALKDAEKANKKKARREE